MLAGPLGVTPDYRVPWMACPPGAIPAAFDAFVKTHREQGRKVWLVHPGARHPVRRWPLHHFEELIATCSVLKNAAIVCVEDADAGKWSCAGDRFFFWKPARLEALAAGMAMCDAVLANDSLPSHLAAAMGVKVWSLFTSQEPVLFAPWNNEGRTISVDVCPHRPCLDRCVMPSVICRDRLSVGRVAERLVR